MTASQVRQRHTQPNLRFAFQLLAAVFLALAMLNPQLAHGGGVTIITHGWLCLEFQTLCTSPSLPGWTRAMAFAIANRSTGNGWSIWVYNPASQRFTKESSFSNGNEASSLEEVILVFDWAEESADPGGGFAEAAGEALFSALMRGGILSDGTAVSFVEMPLHFIGHSRGAVVNSEAVERLGAVGVDVDHVTTLDPHPANGSFFFPGDVYEDAVASILTWENVNFADNYYRKDFLWESDTDFNGTNVSGALNVELNEDLLDRTGLETHDPGYPREHSDTHLWYYGTIDLSASANNSEENVPSEFYSSPNPARTDSGFYFSRIVEGARQRHTASAGLKGVGARGSIFEQTWIANGSFSYGRGIQLSDIAGFSHHGGNTASFGSEGANSFCTLRVSDAAGTTESLRHNQTYVPVMQGGAVLKFKARFRYYFFDEARLVVFGFGKQLWSYNITTGSDWQDIEVDLGSVEGQTGTLEFRLEDSFFLGTEVDTDDIRIVGDSKKWPNIKLKSLAKTSYLVAEQLAVEWDLSDDLTTHGALVDVIWDMDQNPYNGSVTTNATGVDSSAGGATFQISGLQSGFYYLYASISNTGGIRYDFLGDLIQIESFAIQVGTWPGYGRECDSRAVAVVGNLAYVADGDVGLQVNDVSNPASPRWVGGYDTSGDAYGVAVSGDYAYVADGSAGLQVIDISNPTTPRRVGGYDTSGYAYGVAVSGSYVYVANGKWGLATIQVRIPRAIEPARFTGVTVTADQFGISVSGMPGVNYTLQRSSDLKSWSPVQTIVIPSSGFASLSLPIDVTVTGRFYRVVTPQQ